MMPTPLPDSRQLDGLEDADTNLRDASGTQRSSASQSELESYSYSYPHKSSYRRLNPPQRLSRVWERESREHLALYVHVPFCEMRCGFCNLFTHSQPGADVVAGYLGALRRQMQVVRNVVGPVGIDQFAIGGGTPTVLSAPQLDSLLTELEQCLEFSVAESFTSVEVSPATAAPEKLEVLARFGVERISIGVQSFDERDLGRLGRPQHLEEVERALHAIRTFGFPVLNIDLIYGDPLQSPDAWCRSLRIALTHSPEEIYLYPLYVRPETGLGRLGRAAGHRTELYRAGRDLLQSAGYSQTSLRCFRRRGIVGATDYSCQRDGMVGLGCGARSYTRELHYSTRFAVTQAGVRAILADWIRQSNEDFEFATHGFQLSEEEQRRRFLILGLLQAQGFDLSGYRSHIGGSPFEDFPELSELRERGWVVISDDQLNLTAAGLEHSDIIGPMLYSPQVRQRLREFVQQ